MRILNSREEEMGKKKSFIAFVVGVSFGVICCLLVLIFLLLPCRVLFLSMLFGFIDKKQRRTWNISFLSRSFPAMFYELRYQMNISLMPSKTTHLFHLFLHCFGGLLFTVRWLSFINNAIQTPPHNARDSQELRDLCSSRCHFFNENFLCNSYANILREIMFFIYGFSVHAYGCFITHDGDALFWLMSMKIGAGRDNALMPRRAGAEMIWRWMMIRWDLYLLCHPLWLFYFILSGTH